MLTLQKSELVNSPLAIVLSKYPLLCCLVDGSNLIRWDCETFAWLNYANL